MYTGSSKCTARQQSPNAGIVTFDSNNSRAYPASSPSIGSHFWAVLAQLLEAMSWPAGTCFGRPYALSHASHNAGRMTLDIPMSYSPYIARTLEMQVATTRTRFVVLALAALVALASCGYWRYQISDAHRLSLFRAHRAEYETLLRMLQHDGDLTFINRALTIPEDPGLRGISPQRISEYRRYMSTISCGSINYLPLIGSALFVSDTQGAANILYFPMQSSAQANRYNLPLDKLPAQAHPIVGNWYLSSEKFR